MRKCRVFDIDWDVSDEDNPGRTPDDLGLPKEIVIDVDKGDVCDVEYVIDKALTSYGYCNFGYRYEWI